MVVKPRLGQKWESRIDQKVEVSGFARAHGGYESDNFRQEKGGHDWTQIG
jgi:hypothetical protein